MYRFFTNLIILVIRFTIQIIESIEYRNISLNEEDLSRKILNSILISGFKVNTDTGYETISSLHLTQPYRHYSLTTESHNISCADNHIVFDKNFEEVFVKNLSVGDFIQTDGGIEKVLSVNRTFFKSSMFDCTVDHPNHRLYTNGILSHNTVISSITILHFVLFNNNKNVLVTANILDTAIEILDKLREIYQRLPYFLQQGISNWNQKFLVFENKSRIKGFATTKTASIGQAADFLYLDEFAYLPDNVADKFYKSVFPTVSNIENSKIIITSTPNGFNLFHKLLSQAEKPEGEKSSYVAKRVYWWQVPKRFVTYIRLNDKKLEEFGITKEIVFEYFKERFPLNNCELVFNTELRKWIINIYNNTECSEDDIIKEEIGDIKILQISDITTWKKEIIKDIGGEEAFNQEYDLRFINTSRSLLEESFMDELIKNKKRFEFREIDEFEGKLKFSYEDLKWSTDEDVYDPQLRKEYKIFISVDVAEGLGLDYSVINIFKLSEKSVDLVEKQINKYRNIVDFIKLVQIGIFRCNLVSVLQLAEVLYLLIFEHFDSENVKVVLEVNTYGNELLAYLPNIFEGNNEYGSSVFYRFKHRIDAIEEKIGLKVGDNKNLMVKTYQDKIHDRSIVVTEEETINEMTTFIKHTTSAGNTRYAADGTSHDDAVMTVVDLSPIFEKNEFKGMVEDYLENCNSELKILIDKCLNRNENVDGLDYTQVLDIRKKYMSNNKRIEEARKNWGLDSKKYF